MRHISTHFNTKEIETADDGTLYPDTIINSSGVEVANTINGAKVADLKKANGKIFACLR